VHLEGTLLARQLGRDADRVDQGGEPRQILDPGADAEPDHARQPAALESADLTKPDLKTSRPSILDQVRDAQHAVRLDGADEANGQMEVGRRRPAKLRRGGCTAFEKPGQRGTLLVGQGQPEEGPYFLRTVGFQFSCTQVLGAVGRHP